MLEVLSPKSTTQRVSHSRFKRPVKVSEADFELIDKLMAWEEGFVAGDTSDTAFCVSAPRADADNDEDPLIFYSPRPKLALEEAVAHGVDITRTREDGTSILFEIDLYDTDSYAYVADQFAQSGEIDHPDDDGITALSVQVKFGRIENARILLDRGASPNSAAQLRRYGGASLSIPQQAIHCVADENITDIEAHTVSLLELLKSYGLSLSPAHKADLIGRSASKPKVQRWIESQF